MKLSELILEEYQANEEKIFKTRDLFENEKQELVLKKLRYEYIKLLDEMPILAQAHKDALYMEEQIERVKPQEATSIDFISSCCICDGQMVATGGKNLDDPTREEYVCKDCHGIEFRVI